MKARDTIAAVLLIAAFLFACWFINDVVMDRHGGNTVCDNPAQDYSECR